MRGSTLLRKERGQIMTRMLDEHFSSLSLFFSIHIPLLILCDMISCIATVSFSLYLSLLFVLYLILTKKRKSTTTKFAQFSHHILEEKSHHSVFLNLTCSCVSVCHFHFFLCFVLLIVSDCISIICK